MITGIFITTADTYVCSNEVELSIGPDQTRITAKSCFSPLKPLIRTQEVVCLVKYDNSPPLSVTCFVKEVYSDGEVVLTVGSDFSTDGVEEVVSNIKKFNLYLLGEESK